MTTANSFGSPAEVVGHRENGLVLVAHEHDLRGVIEEAGVRLGDVETAERADLGVHERERGGEGRAPEDESFHAKLLSATGTGSCAAGVPFH